MKKRRVLKFGTGAEIPEGAEYLCTKVQNLTEDQIAFAIATRGPTWLVWHYFLVTEDA